MDLPVDEHKWRACALRYPQAGREMAFSGQAPGAVAVFTSPRGWECIHTYVVQQEEYNRFEQVASRVLTPVLLCAKLGHPQDASSAFSEQFEDLTRWAAAPQIRTY
jgi:hypothetical protein